VGGVGVDEKIAVMPETVIDDSATAVFVLLRTGFVVVVADTLSEEICTGRFTLGEEKASQTPTPTNPIPSRPTPSRPAKASQRR
jgi:hypothetical protein